MNTKEQLKLMNEIRDIINDKLKALPLKNVKIESNFYESIGNFLINLSVDFIKIKNESGAQS